MGFHFTLKHSRRVALLASIFISIIGFASLACRRTPAEAVSLNTVHTLAAFATNGEAKEGRALFGEPFGVAAASDGTVYVSDGERGRVWAIGREGERRLVASGLRTPSGLAIAPDDSLLIAETGAHVIRRLKMNGTNIENTVIAGRAGQAGFADGAADASMFNAPVGVAVGNDGVIYVADTYNDRIRRIETSANGATMVRTVAGDGVRGFVNSMNATQARFDTPCGVAVLADGALLIADTGNNRLRLIEMNGETRTIIKTATPPDTHTPNTTSLSPNNADSTAMNNAQGESEAEFSEPVGVTADAFGNVYITEAAGARVQRLKFNRKIDKAENASSNSNKTVNINAPHLAEIETIIGISNNTTFVDGDLQTATLQRPNGIAATPQGEIVFADSENRAVRFIGNRERMRGGVMNADEVRSLQPQAASFRGRGVPRWCYAPVEKAREIAATFGEVRGMVAPDEDGRFHNGIDIPGAYGETVLAIRDDVVLRPLALEGTGGARERLRLAAFGYIHLRLGRDKDDREFNDARFMFERDENGKVTKARVRRGTIFQAGERLGTLNNQNHTHLVAGAYGNELNPLAALELPGIKDDVAPVIETNGIRFLSPDNLELNPAKPNTPTTNKKASGAIVEISGDVSIVARVYDRMTGDAERRRLGVYRLGYQILNDDGTSVANFENPRWTLTFDRLPVAARATGFGANTVYAIGSQAGYSPQTVFDYIITNTLRDGVTTEEFWRTGELPKGIYRVRVLAEDFFGNQSSREARVRIN